MRCSVVCPLIAASLSKLSHALKTSDIRPSIKEPDFPATTLAWEADDIQQKWEDLIPGDGQKGWLGGDSDVSVIIGGGSTGRRVLWIFADTYLTRYNATGNRRVREDDLEMPSSTIGLAECPPDEAKNKRRVAECHALPEMMWRKSENGTSLPFFNVAQLGETIWPVAAVASDDGDTVYVTAQTIGGDTQYLNVLGTRLIVLKGTTQDDPFTWTMTSKPIGNRAFTWFSGMTRDRDFSTEYVYFFGHRHATAQGTMANGTASARIAPGGAPPTGRAAAAMQAYSTKGFNVASLSTQQEQERMEWLALTEAERMAKARDIRISAIANSQSATFFGEWSNTLLARMKLSDMQTLATERIEYYAADSSWKTIEGFKGALQDDSVLSNDTIPLKELEVPTWESTASYSEELGLWYVFHISGWTHYDLKHFVKPTMQIYMSESLTGHWTNATFADVPLPWAGTYRQAWVCYAPKAHPEWNHVLTPDNNDHKREHLVFSYICNSWDRPGQREKEIKQLFQDDGMNLAVRGYWPKFMRVRTTALT